jgi:ABC-2 type transport system permease protein
MIWRALLEFTRVEWRLFFRQPVAAFFTLAFPLLILFVFGSIFGNTPVTGSQFGAMDLSVPSYVGMIVGTTAFMGLPGWIATYRELGVFRRFRVTPVSPVVLLVSQGLIAFAATTLGLVLLMIAARFVFGVAWPAAPFSLIMALILSCAAMFGLGMLIGAAAPTGRAAQAVGTVVFFPLLFLSGAAFPRMLMPSGVRRVSDFLPLTHVAELLRGVWLEGEWRGVSVVVLIVITVLAAIIATRVFRWD